MYFNKYILQFTLQFVCVREIYRPTIIQILSTPKKNMIKLKKKLILKYLLVWS